MIDSDAFVRIVRILALEGTAASILSEIDNPPAVSDSKRYLARSDWYRSLPDNEKGFVEDVVWMAAEQAVTSVLCIIDGAQAIESGPDKGRLELYYSRGNIRQLLNGINEEPLNDRL